MEYGIVALLLICSFGAFYWVGRHSKQTDDIEKDLNNLSKTVHNAKQDHAKIDNMSHDERLAFLRRKKP